MAIVVVLLIVLLALSVPLLLLLDHFIETRGRFKPIRPRLFKPITEKARSHPGRSMFRPALEASGVRATQTRHRNTANGHGLAGIVRAGKVCWTTGMSREACQCPNCIAQGRT